MPALALAPRRAPRSPGRARGFTLVELLIAMSAGLMVSMAAFLLAKNATAFFQHEARISAAQLSATLGMNRLTGDIQRAAFLGTPNIRNPNAQNGRKFCGDLVTLPPGLQALAGLRIEPAGSVNAHASDLTMSTVAPNGFAPDSIIVSGNFDANPELFAVDSPALGNNGGLTFTLRSRDGAMARTRANAIRAGVSLGDQIAQIFRPGRFLRVADDGSGHVYYGVVSGSTVTGNAPTEIVQVQAAPVPAFPIKGPTDVCGIRGDRQSGIPLISGNQLLVSAVTRIRYDLRSLAKDPRYQAVVAPVPGAFDNPRTELVRVELAADGTELADTLELVSEFTVDLKFGVTVASRGSAPVLTNYPVGDPTGYQFARDVTTFPAGDPQSPELIRAVQVRLSTRARAPDREGPDLLPPGSTVDGRRIRFLVDNSDPLRLKWARLRTLYSTVTVPNQGGYSL
jgi:prepilin-type N-terminal cleavage/methylation domain-containing protein